MKPHLQTLINLLTQNDLKALLAHYQTSTEQENIAQLAFLFQQGQKNLASYEFYQLLATQFITSKGLPVALIAKIKTSATLSFFTPALQLQTHFNNTDQLQRNVLHYLFAGNLSGETAQPPFNYVRSMMLFERNQALRAALCQRDCDHFTPVEAYLARNQNLSVLAAHELTALMALIEIESKQKDIVVDNYFKVIQAAQQLGYEQGVIVDSDLQRLILIATYYTKPLKQLVIDLQG